MWKLKIKIFHNFIHKKIWKYTLIPDTIKLYIVLRKIKQASFCVSLFIVVIFFILFHSDDVYNTNINARNIFILNLWQCQTSYTLKKKYVKLTAKLLAAMLSALSRIFLLIEIILPYKTAMYSITVNNYIFYTSIKIQYALSRMIIWVDTVFKFY